jgi:hypothetical protein
MGPNEVLDRELSPWVLVGFPLPVPLPFPLPLDLFLMGECGSDNYMTALEIIIKIHSRVNSQTSIKI